MLTLEEVRQHPACGWLRNSLKASAVDARKAERRNRAAFTEEPYRSFTAILAEAHALAARVYEQRLAELLSGSSGESGGTHNG